VSYRIATERVSHETVEGEVVILDRLSGSYFSLTGAGADAWALFAEPRTPELVAETLVGAYDADEATVRTAVLALIAELVREDILVVAPAAVLDDDASAAAPPIPARAAVRRRFAAPCLEKFTDLKDMLLLDPIHDVDESGWPVPAKTAG
jgi:hypothetical protein